jgi:hypothetical protein
MFLFHTRLFINGLPVDYSVTKVNETYVFDPFFNPHDDLVASAFSVQIANEIFIFQNMEDRDIKAQAEEAIKEYLESRLN